MPISLNRWIISRTRSSEVWTSRAMAGTVFPPVTERDLTDIYDQLKKLVDTLKRWSSTWGGLKVWSRDDDRKQYVEWKRRHAELSAASDEANGSQ